MEPKLGVEGKFFYISILILLSKIVSAFRVRKLGEEMREKEVLFN